MGFFKSFYSRQQERRARRIEQGFWDWKRHAKRVLWTRPLSGDPLEAVKINGLMLCHISDQTPELCMAAVRQSPRALFWVHEQTPEIVMEAVSGASRMVFLAKEQSPELCMAAVKSDCRALLHIRNQTEAVCRIAVAKSPLELFSIRDFDLACHLYAEYDRPEDRLDAFFQRLAHWHFVCVDLA